MAANDFRILKNHYGVQRFRTEANVELGIAPGDLVNIGGTGTNFVSLMLDGEPAQGTDLFVGVTRSTSTATASANGVIDVELCGQGSILEGKATTTTNINTDAKLLLLLLDYVTCDRSAVTAAGVLTIDENEGTTTATSGFMILDGDIVKGTLKVACTSTVFWEGTV